jgi:hypothetical protein
MAFDARGLIGDLLYGVTAIVGADTITGPLFLAYGHGEGATPGSTSRSGDRSER